MSTSTDLASDIRTVILDIRDLYRELPDVIASIAGLHATRYDRGTIKAKATDTTITGGDAMVLAVNVTAGNGGVKLGRGETTESIAWFLEAERKDAPSVLAVLTSIEDGWRVEQDQPGSPITSVDASIAFLVANAPWAATNSGTLEDDLNTLYTLRGRLRAATGHIDTPKASDAPCRTCNGTIVQRYRSANQKNPELGGLDDTRECNRCGETYTAAQYMIAVRVRLESLQTDHDRLVTASEARIIWALSAKQIYVWEGRTNPDGTPKITSAARDGKGRKLYRNGDIAKLRKAS